jgi:hypothetical protein
MNWRLSAHITGPDVGTKVLVRSLGGLEDGGGQGGPVCPESSTQRQDPVYLLCIHGNVTHGDFRGVSGDLRTQPGELYDL